MNTKNMKRKVSTIISVLLMSIFMLTIVLNMNLGVVSAYPGYIDSYNSIYGGGSCSTCHSEGQTFNWLNSYGTLFRDQANHVTDPKTALMTIGAPIVDTTTKDKFKVSPTIRIIQINGEITSSQDGLVELILYNPGENSVSMNADIRISQSVNLPVYGQGFTKLSDLEMYGKFEITPGETKELYIQFKHIVGFDFAGSIDSNVKFTGTYYPGNNKDVYQPINSGYTFKVIKTENTPVVTTVVPTPTVKESTTPTINFYGDKTDVNVGENILTKVSILNPVSNPSLVAKVIILPSSGMSVTSADFTKVSAGQFSADYTLRPGDVRDIEVRLTTSQAGDFNMEGRVEYYFGGDSRITQSYISYVPVKVRALVTKSPTSVPTVMSTPKVTKTPTGLNGLYSFDNIWVDHTIQLCDVTSDSFRERYGGPLKLNCGKTVFNLDEYPLDVLPSGGQSGKISDSEMVYVDVFTSGSMSLIPWRTQPVTMKWYDGSDNRLMYIGKQDVNNIDNRAGSYIGRFSHEINKPGKYYIDVEVVDFGTQRIVFDVIGNDNGQVGVTYNARPTPVQTSTVRPTVTYTPRSTVTYTNNPTSSQTNEQCVWCDVGNMVGTTVGNFAKSFGKAVWNVFT